ncbi:hypothetical protein [Caldisphaera sp.]|uniref:hypothetical protein n=1 Tax=Caldisphaera sp. TaxID=2060322 RepID=UPI0025B83C7B|nr:hypothetical protein [Caldisphaera sp.]
MSSSLSERGFITVTAIVWAALAVVGTFAIIYTGISGVVFSFVMFVVAVPSWVRTVREREGHNDDLEKRLGDLANRMSELSS